MNKRLIASLLAVSMVVGTGLHIPGQLMASTIPTSNQSRIESKDVNYTDAVVSKFDLSGDTLRGYDKQYKISSNQIKSITNNGGRYADRVIANAIDGKINTNWHSGRQNTSSFTNEVIIELNELTTLNRIVYAAPRGTNRGFAERFDIYTSNTSKGNNFELVSSGSSKVTQDAIEIKFNPTEFKRVKFVFKKGYENWACAAEFGLYKEDVLSQTMKELFANGLMMEVNPRYNTLEAITVLEEKVKEHPLKESFLDDIKLAKDIASNKNLFNETRVVTGEQRGPYKEGTSKRSIDGKAYASFESLGKYVTTKEEIVVYVDADPKGVLPTLAFGQVGKDIGGWRRLSNLKPGKNVIKAPANINPSALYLVNEAYPKDQAYAPRIRVEGGTKFPTYFHGETDPQDFFEELKAYATKVEYADAAFKNGNPKGKVFNIAEFVSKNVVITTSAKGAVAGIQEASKKGYTVADTMNDWEEMYDMFQTFMGFEKDATEEKHSYFPNKFVARVFQGVPLGFADHGYTGYLGSGNAERDGGFFKLIAMPPQMPGNDSWAYNHEFGHIFNTGYIVHGEVTNNLYAQEYKRIKGTGEDWSNWNSLMKRFQGERVKLGFFENLGVLTQLNIAYGYDTYGKASKVVRDNTQLIASIKGGSLRRLAVAYSLAVGENLLDFFEGWNYTDVTPQMKEMVKHLPKPSRKIEYLHGGAHGYTGNGFSEDLDIKVSSQIDKEAKTNLLKFEIDRKNQSDLLGYEILKDGKVIGFTKDSRFRVKNINGEQNESYQVVAYAKNLTISKPVNVNSFTPNIQVQQEKISMGLNEVFNPIDYIRGFTYKGEDITYKVKVEHNVDITNKGLYEVKYTLLDEGITTEKIIQVEIVSGYDYLSDMKWQSAETQWATPRRNSSIKGRVNGVVKAFKKGFGIHAKGKIIYDLSNKTYDRFEALLGIDMGLGAQNNSSVAFKIIGDGEVLATTKVIRHADNMAYINVPISGISKLVIEINDGGNGNTSDHAIIVNPKLTTNNALPKIKAKDKFIKLGEVVDFMEGIEATDAEDGDLTSKIEILSNTYEQGKAGKFEVIYGVMDRDNNRTEKKVYLTIYEDLAVKKSKYGQFNNLAEYNKQFKLPISAISNNGGNYGGSVIAKAIDGNLANQWETGKPNNNTFKNEVIFDLGENTDIDKMVYAARRGGKGFANRFEIYVSNEAEGNNFTLSGKGEYRRNGNDVIEFKLTRSDVRRVKFVFLEANQGWASIGEVAFYKADPISDKVTNDLFVGEGKTQVTQAYNTLEKLAALREEVKNHPASAWFEADLNKAEVIIKTTTLALDVEEIKQLNEKGYTVDSWAELMSVKKEASSLLDRVVTQAQVDKMLVRLATAKEHLVKVGAKLELENLVKSLTEIQSHIYTEQSWKALLGKLEAAKAILVLEEVSDEMVNIAKEELQVAINRLEISKGKASIYELLIIANAMEQSNYRAEADWTNFKEMRAYYNDLYWAAATHREDMYQEAIRYFNWLIGDIESYRIIQAEVGVPEVGVPEVGVPEVGVPEVGVPEVGVPEVGVPEVGVPEVGVPEVGVPEVGVPEVGVPEVGVPEVGVPEVGVPEVGVPEVGVPEVGVPEVGVPEVEAPEVETPEVETPEVETPEAKS